MATNNNNDNGRQSQGLDINSNNEVISDFDYQKDQETFQKFIVEYEILINASRGNREETQDDDDEDMMIPYRDDGAPRLIRKVCYKNHLQRIKDRHFYSNDNDNDANNNASSSSSFSSSTFIIEVPLNELILWDNIIGKDLANHVMKNTMRYHAIFCNAIDTVLETMTESTTNTTTSQQSNRPEIVRDPIDILHQQRISIMEQNRLNNNTNNNNQNNDGTIQNVYARNNGPLQNDPAAAANNNNNQNNVLGASEEFPPILMRRYELRILPFHRRGTLPPFINQHIVSTTNTSSTTKPITSTPSLSIRQIRSAAMGKLVTISGMIVRSSDVKPSCQVATYSCDYCGSEIYQVLSTYHREFMPAKACPSVQCQNNGMSKKTQSLFLQTRGSKLIKFQELKLQELSNQVPMGHIPRSITIICRGELTRLATPGDIVTIDGIFLPQRMGGESGFKAMKAGLISTTYIEAQNLIIHKKSYDELSSTTDDNQHHDHMNNPMLLTNSTSTGTNMDHSIMKIATSIDPIGIIASNIAPEIFGHEDIKRSLLLQLVSGCTRVLPDGMKIRGDINILLMGDPGVAKSQLLKHISTIAPRGVYTTGKGSSGVGLTAAVTKDTTTGEMSLEGGALVLADKGICCIDEFDKMDESDRTSIHEVMEQQTVSIAKAGIIATLNARTSVLAAANPVYGRYNRSKSLSDNINLPNSLLSRFDLLFLILDIPNIDNDIALAQHVTFVHQNEGLTNKKTNKNQDGSSNNNSQSQDDNEDMDEGNSNSQGDNTSNNKNSKMVISSEVLREYIARARQYQPIVSADVAPYIVEAYVSLRMDQKNDNKRNQRKFNNNSNKKENHVNDQTVMTARQLLSILRISQALARLRFSDYVAREDVDEAIRLTHMSKASLTNYNNDNNGDNGNNKQKTEDTMSRIFHIIRDYYTQTKNNSNRSTTNTDVDNNNNNGGDDNNGIDLKLCEAMILRKGFTQQQLFDCLQEYEELNVIQINRSRTHVYFL